MRYSNIPPKGSIPPAIRAHQQRYVKYSAYETPSRDTYAKSDNYAKLNKFRLAVRQTLQEKLEWTVEEAKLCKESGLDTSSLTEIIRRLEEQLKYYW